MIRLRYVIEIELHLWGLLLVSFANSNSQLEILVARAEEAIGLAIDYADHEELDRAYVQYLRASEITINIIPHHPDYRATVNQSPAWYKQFANLMMV